jgi:hypothetical protein
MKSLRIRSERSFRLLPKLLLAAGLSIWGSHNISIVPECRAEALAHLTTAIKLDGEQALERELLTLTNQHRTRQGLQALTPDEALVQIAREHSIGMAEQGFISHDLPSGNLKTRMTRAGYLHEVVRENVASAPTVLKAQNALVDSTGHENNILAKDVTRVGIGIARCRPPFDKELYITEIFASPREEFQTDAVHGLLLNQINERSIQNGFGSALPDPVLEKLASRSVLSLNMPYRKEELQKLLADSAIELQKEGALPLARVGASVQLLHSPKDLIVPDQVLEGQARGFGTAVRKIVDSLNQPAFLVLTLIGYTSN